MGLYGIGCPFSVRNISVVVDIEPEFLVPLRRTVSVLQTMNMSQAHTLLNFSNPPSVSSMRLIQS